MTSGKLPTECIPPVLCERPQWVCWKYVERDGKRTKVPIDARHGRNASVKEPATWTTVNEAVATFERFPGVDGIGYVFSAEDPFCGVDLDRCLDADGAVVWGQDIIDQLATYTEISPSGRGVKLFLEASKPDFARCRRDGFGPDGDGEIEIYDRERFFVVTGNRLPGTPAGIEPRQGELDSLCRSLWPQATETTVPNERCLRSMLAMDVMDHSDGSHRLFVACCRCVEHDLADGDALACIREYARQKPFPTNWSDGDILRRLRDAERHCRRGEALQSDVEPFVPAIKSVRQLLADHPELRPPVIHGLLRVGESMNVIAPSKLGKSWLVTDLALSLASGRPWLGTFQTEPGPVLLIDNELHSQTSANRIPKVAGARGIPLEDIADAVFIENLRGRLKDILSLAPYFRQLRPGYFKIIVLDAFYRFLPKGTDENSNANLAEIYNQLDWYADQIGCSFVLVHHASKGNQSGKTVTDVGAGAGSQSRAADTHLILRPHEERDCVVIDAAVRSWPPIEPRCLRWTFPVWTPDDSLDPAALRSERPRRRTRTDLSGPEWNAQRFIEEFANTHPKPTQSLLDAAVAAGLSERKARLLIRQAEAGGLLYRWSYGANRPVEFATVPQEVSPSTAG